MSLRSAGFFEELDLDETGQVIAVEVLKEIRGRLGFLLRCGLDYLTLDRTAPTLSGGESQRIRLAGRSAAGLVGVVYILDEPSIGLHPRDNEMLLESLCDLRDQGNTVIVVEHDEETMRAADHIVDFGPGPGVRGGEIVARERWTKITQGEAERHGTYLAGKEQIAVPEERGARSDARNSRSSGRAQQPQEASTWRDPLESFICVTGVSGLGQEFARQRHLVAGAQSRRQRAARERRAGTRRDRRPEARWTRRSPSISRRSGGRPRSNPATYIKVFDRHSRSVRKAARVSRLRGTSRAGSASTSAAGRCEACEGNGSNKLEMDFLADIWVTCPVCEGHRFNRETLEVRFKGKNIADVLEMDVQQALEHFENGAQDRQAAANAARRGPRLPEAGPALADALRRRGAADQTRTRTGQTFDGAHDLSARRADDRVALCRHSETAGSAARIRRSGQHRAW